MARITRKEAQRKRQERMKKIPELYRRGITIEKMKDIFKTSAYKISGEINELIDKGLITRDMIRERNNVLRNGAAKRIEERCAEVLLLYAQGKTNDEISSIVGCSDATIQHDMARLKREGKITKELEDERIKNFESRKTEGKIIKSSSYGFNNRRKTILKLYLQGKTIDEIASITQSNKKTISNDIEFMKNYRIITENVYDTQLQGPKDMFNDFLLEYKKQLNEGKLQKERLLTIKTIANYTGKYQHVVFAIKVHIKFGNKKTAIELIEKNINNKSYTEEQIEKLKKMKEYIENRKYTHQSKGLELDEKDNTR